MYKCQKCKTQTTLRESQHLVTVETRAKTYYCYNKAKQMHTDEIEGVGREIQKALIVCSKCATQLAETAV